MREGYMLLCEDDGRFSPLGGCGIRYMDSPVRIPGSVSSLELYKCRLELYISSLHLYNSRLYFESALRLEEAGRADGEFARILCMQSGVRDGIHWERPL